MPDDKTLDIDTSVAVEEFDYVEYMVSSWRAWVADTMAELDKVDMKEIKLLTYFSIIEMMAQEYYDFPTLKVNSSQVEFSIVTVFPVNGRIRQDILNDIDDYINDFSIGINITVGDFSCLLTGDVQNDMIYYASTVLFNEVPVPNVLKIPHHGSKGSITIVDLFQSSNSEFSKQTNVSITTSKKSSRLPRIEALNKYSSNSEKLLFINSEATDVAMWGIEVDILNATIKELCRENFNDYNAS